MPHETLVPERGGNLLSNLAKYQLFSNSYRGSMIYPAEGTLDPGVRYPTFLSGSNRNQWGVGENSYLRVLQAEVPEEYTARLKTAHYENLCAEVIRVFLASIFRPGYVVDRESIRASLTGGFESIYENIDLKGNSIEDFLQEVMTLGLVYGWVGVFTTQPQGVVVETLADQKDVELRPYSRIYTPEDIWNWGINSQDGDWDWVLLSDAEDTWLWVYRDEWYRVDGEGRILESGLNPVGRVPLDLYLCDANVGRTGDEPFGLSSIKDIAFINLDVFQQWSLLGELIRKSNYPSLHIKMPYEQYSKSMKDAKRALPVGPGWHLVTEADVDWISPAPTSIQEARATLGLLIGEVKRVAGIGTRSEESIEAHSGLALAWEYSDKLTLIQMRAESLRRFETSLWATYDSYIGVGIPHETLKYPATFVTSPKLEDMDELQKMLDARLPLEIVRTQAWDLAYKRYSHKGNLPEIKDSIDTWDPYSTGEKETDDRPPSED